MTSETFICDAEQVQERAAGLRFALQAGGEPAVGFVVRFDGKLFGYLNRCAHVPIELDWEHGQFFESSKLYLMCSTHGAIYEPNSGRCVGGPCRGARLRQIPLIEKEDKVYWQSTEYFKPLPATP